MMAPAILPPNELPIATYKNIYWSVRCLTEIIFMQKMIHFNIVIIVYSSFFYFYFLPLRELCEPSAFYFCICLYAACCCMGCFIIYLFICVLIHDWFWVFVFCRTVLICCRTRVIHLLTVILFTYGGLMCFLLFSNASLTAVLSTDFELFEVCKTPPNGLPNFQWCFNMNAFAGRSLGQNEWPKNNWVRAGKGFKLN